MQDLRQAASKYSDDDDFFAQNEDGAEDNLAPERFRKTSMGHGSRSVARGTKSVTIDESQNGKVKSSGDTQTSTTQNSEIYRTHLLPDEVSRLPDLPDFSNFKCSDIWVLIRFGLEFITRNGQTTYKAPIPPTSDVNELEYISALHQCSSMAELRQDCSISADEIATFLKSRHGLCVDPEIVRKTVLQDGLTADKNDDEKGRDMSGGTMDLVELTSALIIPNLLRLRRAHIDAKRIDAAQGKAKLLLQSPTSTNSTASVNFVKKGKVALSDDVNILKDALALMLEDCTGDATPKTLDENLVRDILCGYGEVALAQDDELVREMVAVAKKTPDSNLSQDPGDAVLDIDAFFAALTSDVSRQYDPVRETRRSTNFEDVWFHSIRDKRGSTVFRETEIDEEMCVEDYIAQLHEDKLHETMRCCQKKQDDDSPESQDVGAVADKDAKKVTLNRVFTSPSVDTSADTFRTRTQVVFVWIAFVLFYVAYLFAGFGGRGIDAEACRQQDQETKEWATTTAAIVCPLIRGIVNQLLMILELLIFGTPFIVFASVGNSIEGQETIWRMVLSMTIFFSYNVVFFTVKFAIPHWTHSPGAADAGLVHYLAFAFTLSVTATHLFHTMMIAIRKAKPLSKLVNQGRFFKWYFLSGNVTYEAKIKRAALFKVDKMLTNAYDIHSEVIRYKERKRTSSDSSVGFLSNFGMAVNEYSKRDGLTTYVGGVGLAWKRIWNGTLFTEDGIWISGRFITGTVFQVVILAAIPVILIIVLKQYVESFVTEDISEGGSQESPEEQEKRYKIAVGVASSFAMLNAMNTLVLYLPSVAATTMKFRRGVIATLRSEDFLHRYRFALDQTTLVFPGMLWGLAISSIAIGALTGGFVFLLLLPDTQSGLFNIIGNLFGLSVILITKIIIMQIIRFTHYKAFYRNKPLSANIINVSMECYAIGISVWFMMVRTIKILVIAALYLGRTDTPLFGPGVGIFGPLEIDNWPTVTRKEILAHDAHRHPYIETLGYLYMMQLRYRDEGFANRACSAWRLVFTLAFMPWLHKYRDSARPDHFGPLRSRTKAMSKPGESNLHSAISSGTLGSGGGMMNMMSILEETSGPGANRMMRGSMVASRWKLPSLHEEENEDDKEVKAGRLKAEIARLQAELSGLESS